MWVGPVSLTHFTLIGRRGLSNIGVSKRIIASTLKSSSFLLFFQNSGALFLKIIQLCFKQVFIVFSYFICNKASYTIIISNCNNVFFVLGLRWCLVFLGFFLCKQFSTQPLVCGGIFLDFCFRQFVCLFSISNDFQI